MPAVAPYVAVTSGLRDEGSVAFRLGGLRLAAQHRDGGLRLLVGSRVLQSRRHGRTRNPTEIGLSITGTHLTGWVREGGSWMARARHDLRAQLDTHDETILRTLVVESDTGAATLAGGFGQLGLRDTRIVTESDGTPVVDGDAVWFTATSAGPGFFDTAHTSVWRFDADSDELTHTADLFFRRPEGAGVYGDHATHLVRDGTQWLVATSTWGDFEQPKSRVQRVAPATLRVILARCPVESDLRHGTHVLDTEELPLPGAGIACWDPHLLRRPEGWLVGYVTAKKFFDFHPLLAGGPSLSDLTLRGAATDRRATEGTTLLAHEGQVHVLASDGRDSRRDQRARYPVFDTSMTEVTTLNAPYLTNLPWPTLTRIGNDWLMLSFNGHRHGGPMLGYGTHGDLVVLRST